MSTMAQSLCLLWFTLCKASLKYLSLNSIQSPNQIYLSFSFLVCKIRLTCDSSLVIFFKCLDYLLLGIHLLRKVERLRIEVFVYSVSVAFLCLSVCLNAFLSTFSLLIRYTQHSESTVSLWNLCYTCVSLISSDKILSNILRFYACVRTVNYNEDEFQISQIWVDLSIGACTDCLLKWIIREQSTVKQMIL